MKIILLVVSLLCLITASSHAHDIYDAKNDFLYVGGRAYYYAQTTVGEEIDRSLISSIARFDIKGRKKIAFYTTDKSIELFKLSPNGKYIAINEVGLVNNIVILNFDGSPVTILEKTIGEFEWSPDSRYLAYITGKVTPEEQYPFKPESLWIYDIIQRKVEKLADKAIKMRFGRHDGKLHYGVRLLERPPVKFSVYDPETKKGEGTPCYGLDFSPDGKYYIRQVSESGNFAVLSSKDNKKLRQLQFDIDTVYWLTNDNVFIFFRPNSFVFDPFKVKILRGFEGLVMGWSPERNYIVTYLNREALIAESLTGRVVKRIRIRE